MPVRHLYNEEYETYTQEAVKIIDEFNSFVSPFIAKLSKTGISLVDLQAILTDQIDLACVFKRAYLTATKRKEETIVG